ncbi:MAG: STAS-like domain-containing protein, partial [bacterium]
MINISLLEIAGSFAENKDAARDLRISKIVPAIINNEEVVLDFAGVESATQSFVHALISDLIRKFGIKVLDIVSFKNCNKTIKQIINIV